MRKHGPCPGSAAISSRGDAPLAWTCSTAASVRTFAPSLHPAPDPEHWYRISERRRMGCAVTRRRTQLRQKSLREAKPASLFFCPSRYFGNVGVAFIKGTTLAYTLVHAAASKHTGLATCIRVRGFTHPERDARPRSGRASKGSTRASQTSVAGYAGSSSLFVSTGTRYTCWRILWPLACHHGVLPFYKHMCALHLSPA